MTAPRFVQLVGLLPVLSLAGCGFEPLRFAANELELVDAQVAPGHAADIEAVLIELFGTPDEPGLPADVPKLAELIGIGKLRHAAGPVVSLEVGETLGLYRRHCARCHGVTGDGRGPTALYQHPYPRDFRRGVFKFTSTPRGVPPTDADLRATLLRGSPGAAMPSFALLAEKERDALVDYVKYLAIRGQLEQALIEFAGDELDYDPATGEEGRGLSLARSDDAQLIIGEMLGDIVDRWAAAASSHIKPPPPPSGFPDALVDQGRQLFADGQRLGCAKCHSGVLDNEAAESPLTLKDYDLWNKRRRDFEQRTAAMPHADAARRRVIAEMLPPVVTRPRRLAEQPLRGGAEPAALFRHIQQGLDGTPMPSVAGVLSDDEVWSLVAYVLDVADRSPASLNDASAPDDEEATP